MLVLLFCFLLLKKEKYSSLTSKSRDLGMFRTVTMVATFTNNTSTCIILETAVAINLLIKGLVMDIQSVRYTV